MIMYFSCVLKHLIIMRFEVSHNSGSNYDEIEFKNLTRLALVKLKSDCNSMSHYKYCREYVPPTTRCTGFSDILRYRADNSKSNYNLGHYVH